MQNPSVNRDSVCIFMRRQPLTFRPVKKKLEPGNLFQKKQTMGKWSMETRNSWFRQESLDKKRSFVPHGSADLSGQFFNALGK